ncbi:hypothetical protein IMG5_145360, partial [Ichthyophthirius multifiliis]
ANKKENQILLYLQDIQSTNFQDLQIPLWRIKDEEILNEISDYLIKRKFLNINKKIEVVFDQIKQKIINIIENAKEKYIEKLGENCDFIQSLIEVFQKVVPVDLIQGKLQNFTNKEDFEMFFQDLLQNQERKNLFQELKEQYQAILDQEKQLNYKNLRNQFLIELPNLLSDHSLDRQESPFYQKQNQDDQLILKKVNSIKEEVKIIIMGPQSVPKNGFINTLIHQEFSNEKIQAKNKSYVYPFQIQEKNLTLVLQEIEEINKQSKVNLENMKVLVLLADKNSKIEELEYNLVQFQEMGVKADQFEKILIFLVFLEEKENENQQIFQNIKEFFKNYKINDFLKVNNKDYQQVKDCFIKILQQQQQFI